MKSLGSILILLLAGVGETSIATTAAFFVSPRLFALTKRSTRASGLYLEDDPQRASATQLFSSGKKRANAKRNRRRKKTINHWATRQIAPKGFDSSYFATEDDDSLADADDNDDDDDVAARKAYDDWRKEFNKGDFDEKRFQIFKVKWEAISEANRIAEEQALELREAIDDDEQPTSVPLPSILTLNEYGDLTEQEYKEAMQSIESTEKLTMEEEHVSEHQEEVVASVDNAADTEGSEEKDDSTAFFMEETKEGAADSTVKSDESDSDDSDSDSDETSVAAESDSMDVQVADETPEDIEKNNSGADIGAGETNGTEEKDEPESVATEKDAERNAINEKVVSDEIAAKKEAIEEEEEEEAEAERIEAEKKALEDKVEAEMLATEEKSKADQAKRVAEAERIAAEAKAAAEKAEQIAAKARAEAEKAEAERSAAKKESETRLDTEESVKASQLTGTRGEAVKSLQPDGESESSEKSRLADEEERRTEIKAAAVANRFAARIAETKRITARKNAVEAELLKADADEVDEGPGETGSLMVPDDSSDQSDQSVEADRIALDQAEAERVASERAAREVDENAGAISTQESSRMPMLEISDTELTAAKRVAAEWAAERGAPKEAEEAMAEQLAVDWAAERLAAENAREAQAEMERIQAELAAQAEAAARQSALQEEAERQAIDWATQREQKAAAERAEAEKLAAEWAAGRLSADQVASNEVVAERYPADVSKVEELTESKPSDWANQDTGEVASWKDGVALREDITESGQDERSGDLESDSWMDGVAAREESSTRDESSGEQIESEAFASWAAGVALREDMDSGEDTPTAATKRSGGSDRATSSTRFDFEEVGTQYMWIGCSDVRPPPRVVKGEDAGRVSVIRNVANLVVETDLSLLSTLEYALDVKQVTDIIVCGHYDCGGIRASIENVDLAPPLKNWLRNVRDIYDFHREELDRIPDPEVRHRRLVELNVIEQCLNLFLTKIMERRVESRTAPRIHACVYDPKTAELKRLEIDFEKYIYGPGSTKSDDPVDPAARQSTSSRDGREVHIKQGVQLDKLTKADLQQALFRLNIAAGSSESKDKLLERVRSALRWQPNGFEMRFRYDASSSDGILDGMSSTSTADTVSNSAGSAGTVHLRKPPRMMVREVYIRKNVNLDYLSEEDLRQVLSRLDIAYSALQTKQELMSRLMKTLRWKPDPFEMRFKYELAVQEDEPVDWEEYPSLQSEKSGYEDFPPTTSLPVEERRKVNEREVVIRKGERLNHLSEQDLRQVLKRLDIDARNIAPSGLVTCVVNALRWKADGFVMKFTYDAETSDQYGAQPTSGGRAGIVTPPAVEQKTSREREVHLRKGVQLNLFSEEDLRQLLLRMNVPFSATEPKPDLLMRLVDSLRWKPDGFELRFKYDIDSPSNSNVMSVRLDQTPPPPSAPRQSTRDDGLREVRIVKGEPVDHLSEDDLRYALSKLGIAASARSSRRELLNRLTKVMTWKPPGFEISFTYSSWDDF